MPNKKKTTKTKKASISKKKIAGVIAGTIIAGSSFWALKSGNHKVILPTYQAGRVIDGDTFDTKNGQRIRLAGLDAPEIGFCGADEAKKELEKLIKNKPLYIKVIYVDMGRRLISYVYTPKGLITTQLLKTGWARVVMGNNVEKQALIAASEYAKKNNLGIYSPKCLSKTPEKPGCTIKGNVRKERDTKIYSMPGCSAYEQIFVQKDNGDQWFCTEAEAKKAGFKRAGNCTN
ncbi:thermonuclease family protein [Patescibacteria group bacterium]|nr:thermonuclease family protein [Patescibacteria group bacterium]